MRVVRYIELSVVLDSECLKLQPEITNSLSALVCVDTQHFSSLFGFFFWCVLNKLIKARQIWWQTGCNKKNIKTKRAQLERKEVRKVDRTMLLFSHSVFKCFRISVNRV